MSLTSSPSGGASPSLQTASADDLCRALRSAVLVRIPGPLRGLVRWFAMRIPAVSNPEIFLHAGLLHSVNPSGLLARFDGTSALDIASGDSLMAAQAIRSKIVAAGSILGIGELQSIADNELLAFDQAPGTRATNWRLWCAVLTWAIIHECADRILPMSDATLRALAAELIALDCSGSYILSVVCSVQDRHRKLGFLAPLSDRLSFACLKRGVLKVSGAPRALRFPIQTSHVVHCFVRRRTPW